MNYQINFGIPEIDAFYKTLAEKAENKTINKNETRLFKKITKAINFLSSNPKHNGLNSHEIKALSIRFSKKTGRTYRVWQSYLENNTPSAGRLYWIYGPDKNDITVIGLEPHPENKKKDGYNNVTLSDIPPVTD